MKLAAPQTSAVKPMRNSNIELLRLAAMWIIVAHHFTVHNANPVAGFGDPLTRAFYNVLLYPTGRTAVGVFVAITVWFLAARPNRGLRDSLRQIGKLEGELVFYSVGIALLQAIVTHSLSFKAIFISFLPLLTTTWWFATAYAAMILLAPFALRGLHTLPARMHGQLCLICLIGYGLLPHLPLITLSPAIVSGLLIDFLVIMVLVTFVRWHLKPESRLLQTPLLLGSIVGGLLIVALLVYLPTRTTGLLQKLTTAFYAGYFNSPGSLPSLMISIPTFLLVMKLRPWHNRLVNLLAGSAFAVYLITDQVWMREILWQHVFTFEKLGYSKGVLLALIAPTLIMTFALLFDLLRRMASKAILKVLRLYR